MTDPNTWPDCIGEHAAVLAPPIDWNAACARGQYRLGADIGSAGRAILDSINVARSRIDSECGDCVSGGGLGAVGQDMEGNCMSDERPKEVWFVTYMGFWQAMAQTAFSFASTVALLGIGAWLNSIVMQMVGFVFLCLMLSAFVRRSSERRTRFDSPQQLADALKARYGVTGRDVGEIG